MVVVVCAVVVVGVLVFVASGGVVADVCVAGASLVFPEMLMRSSVEVRQNTPPSISHIRVIIVTVFSHVFPYAVIVATEIK